VRRKSHRRRKINRGNLIRNREKERSELWEVNLEQGSLTLVSFYLLSVVKRAEGRRERLAVIAGTMEASAGN